MNIIKGLYQLAKFRTKKEPLVLLYLVVSLILIIACIAVIIKGEILYGFFNNHNDKYLLIEIGLALICLFFTSIGRNMTERLNNTYRVDLNIIRTKYGIKTK